MRLPLLGEISFFLQGKGTPSDHITTLCTIASYLTPAEGGKSNQYWSLV